MQLPFNGRVILPPLPDSQFFLFAWKVGPNRYHECHWKTVLGQRVFDVELDSTLIKDASFATLHSPTTSGRLRDRRYHTLNLLCVRFASDSAHSEQCIEQIEPRGESLTSQSVAAETASELAPVPVSSLQIFFNYKKRRKKLGNQRWNVLGGLHVRTLGNTKKLSVVLVVAMISRAE